MAILDLTTYKSFKNITSPNADVELQNIIDAVNSYIVSYCGRTFNDYVSTDKVEYFNEGSTELYPLEYPLISVTSIKVSTDAGKTYATTLTEFTDYIIDKTTSSIRALGSYFVNTGYPINAIEVTYKGGETNVPADIILAAVNLVEYFMEDQFMPSKAFKGVTIENITTIDANLPPHIKRVLDHHRALTI